MNTIDLVGYIATGITLVYTCLGVPAQAIKHYKMKSTAGSSIFMYLMFFFTVSSWIIYALLKHDYYILASNVPGAIGASVILIQFYRYRRSV